MLDQRNTPHGDMVVLVNVEYAFNWNVFLMLLQSQYRCLCLTIMNIDVISLVVRNRKTVWAGYFIIPNV